MWPDAGSDEAGHGDDYRAESDGPVYDDWWELKDGRAYWRRRFIILCAGVVALGVCAWLLPAAYQPSKRQAAAAAASMDALARQQALPSAANGPAWPGPSSTPNVYPTAATTSPSPTQSASPTQSPSPTATTTATKASTAYQPKSTASASPSRSTSASPSGTKAGACAPADIVLSLFTSKPSYAKGEHPSFSVYAVSTAAAQCTMTYGVGAVQVVVTQRGHVMWNSAACKPTPAQTVRFTRGVPQMLTIAWNPTVKQPAGCAGSLPTGTAATLDAVAVSHGQSSPVRSFKLAN